MDLNTAFTKYRDQWDQIDIPPSDRVVMAQIETLFAVKWERSQELSTELGIPFAVDGYSHFALGEQDGEVFYRYYDKLRPGTRQLLRHGAKGIHVETFNHVKKYIKQDIITIYGRANA